MNENDFSNLGEQIRNSVQSAIDSMDFKQLNRNINDTVNRALQETKQRMKKPDIRGTAESGKTVREKKEIVPLKTNPVGRTAGILYIVFGSIGIGISLILILTVLILVVLLGSPFGLGIGALAFLFVLLGGSSVLVGIGTSIRSRLSRLKSYVVGMNGRFYCPIQELADRTGRNRKFVVKDLRKMIRLGMFQEIYLDSKETCVILNKETYEQYQKTEAAFEQRQRLTKEEEKTKGKREKPEMDQGNLSPYQEMVKVGESFLDQLRAANAAIPGEVISSKLCRLERVVERIFEAVKKHPDEMEEMEKFMEYYLPTTVKLVTAYREFDSEQIQGENIRSAKREIEETLDTINQAFERLLDDMYQDTAFDISTDARVLQTMLEKDGWTNSDFSQEDKR